jgi:hypothetical protein
LFLTLFIYNLALLGSCLRARTGEAAIEELKKEVDELREKDKDDWQAFL